MFGISYEDILRKIKEEKGVSEKEIELLVDKKLTQYGDLISKEGAIHIVANELRVKVFDENLSARKFKVSNILPGMNFVNLDVKVVSTGEVRSFKTDKREGRVVNLVVGDETGIVRLVLWDEKFISLVEKGEIKINDVLSVKNSYSRGTDTFPELHLGSRGNLTLNPEGVEVKDTVMMKRSYMKKKIVDLKDNDSVEIIGTVVQVFDLRFYSSCSNCGKKVEMNENLFRCEVHGNVIPVDVPILNLFLDDGSDNVRVVLFRDLVKRFIGNDVLKYKDNPNEFENIRSESLGKQFKISGRVNKNAMFDRVEFMAQEVSEVNALEMADDILKEMDTKF